MNLVEQLKKWTTLHESLTDYGRDSITRDALAGLSVGVMLVPQAMAYAVLADLPPLVGLFASIIPLLIYAVVGGSRHLAFGIVAIDMLILGTGLQRVVPPDDPNYVTYAFALAGMVGAIQLIMAFLKLGFLVNFLSRPVVIGFTTAAPILIALSQVDNLTGIGLERSAAVHETIWQISTGLDEAHFLTFTIGVVCIAALYGMRWLSKRIPGALIAVALATLVSWFFGFESSGVDTLGSFEAQLPTPVLPIPPFEIVRDLLPTALTLALVQFMALMSIAKAFGARAGYQVDADQELRALGVANFVGAIFRSTPVSGSFSRSSLNFDADAATPLNNVWAAGTVVLSILFLSPVFEFIPMPALAAIIFVSALGMVVPRDIRILFRIKRADGLVALITLAMTLIFGIQEGVLLGVGAAMALILYRSSRPGIYELERDAPTERWHPPDERGWDDGDLYEGIMVLQIDASLTFVNAEYVKERVVRKALVERSIQAVVLDFRGVNDVDATAVATLENLVEVLDSRNVALYLSNVKAIPLSTLEAADLIEQLPDPGVFMNTETAVVHIREHSDQSNGFLGK